MGLLGYELIILGFACTASKAEWMIPIRKYLMLLLLTIGFCLTSTALWDTEPSLSILFGFLTIIWFSLLIWVICSRHQQTEKVLHIPAESYEIEAVDRIGTPAIQLRYLLIYQDKIYMISTLPPKGKPPLILHTKTQKNSDIILADIAIDTINKKLLAKQRLHQLHKILVLITALFLPVSYMMYENRHLSQNLMPNCIMIVLGFLTISATRNSKPALYRLIYWFAVFLEVTGWIIIPVTFLLN